MKHGEFVGKAFKPITEDRFNDLVKLIEYQLCDVGLHYKNITAKRVEDFVDDRDVACGYITIELDRVPKKIRTLPRMSTVAHLNKITIMLVNSDGYSTYEKCLAGGKFDMFNQLSMSLRTDGAEREYRRRYWYGYVPRQHYFYGETTLDFKCELEGFFEEIKRDIFFGKILKK